MALTDSARLGPYEITALIGEGGMGEVYRATDNNLGRQVAIKLLPDAFASDPERLARFEREAKTLAALNHSNIAQIYGLERSNGITAIVMELVEGPTLADRIARGAIPVDEALSIAKQLTEALEAAHEQGIVHRDLKPANVKLRGDGTVKVLDFGLAKALVPVGAMSPGVAQSPTITSPAMMTGVGMLLGTAAYMSPEQARGKAVDKRADIWAFGCVLFEMLTGQRAFPGDDITDTIASVVKTEPDWHRLPSEVPLRVRRVLRVCLDKDPRKRGGDISAIRLALDGVFEPDAPTEAPGRSAGSGHRRSTLLPWSVAAGALIALAGLWLRPSAPPEVIRYQIQAPAGSRLPFGTPAVSPDGRTLAYVVEGPDGVGRIHICPIDRIEARVLQGTEGARHPFWAPDGHALAFAADGYVKRVDLAGGVPQTLAQTGAPWHGAWNQRDEILFLAGNALLPLQRIAARGGQPSPVPAEGTFPAFLPDGERFLVHSNGSIELRRLGSTDRTVVLADVPSAPILALTPVGKIYLLYLRQRDLMARRFDERSGTVLGSEALVVPGIGTVASPALLPTAGVSAKGILAYQAGENEETGQLTWFDRAGKTLEVLPSGLYLHNPVLSPDGLSFVGIRTATFRELFIVDLQRRVRQRVPFDLRQTLGVAWSPDAKRLAVGQQGGRPGFLVNTETGQAEPLPEIGPVDAWSPDGRYVAVRQGNITRLIPVDGKSAPVDIAARGPVSDGRFSADSRYLAVTVTEAGRTEVYVQEARAGGSSTRVSVDGGSNPRWGKDPSELFFFSLDGAVMVAALQLGKTVSTSVPRELFRLGAHRFSSSFDVSGDGQRFLVSSLSAQGKDAPITVVVNWWTELAHER